MVGDRCAIKGVELMKVPGKSIMRSDADAPSKTIFMLSFWPLKRRM